jgi:hypothetical protein
MSSIIGDKSYRNAADTSSGGWAVTDKIFGYLDKTGDIYNKIRYPQPGDIDYDEYAARKRAEQMGIMGLPKPWGGVILFAVIGIVGIVIYNIATKQQSK